MTASVDNRRVVAFGGGTGMAALLAGLKECTRNITAVVTVSDNGGSSGILRYDYDIAPGDIRNCLLALADVDPLLAKALQYRFEEGDFKGHCLGNLLIAVIKKLVGSFEGSVRALNSLLNVCEPGLSLLQCARDDHVVHLSVKARNTAEIKDAPFPKHFQRVAKDLQFSFFWSVRRVEHQRDSRP